MYALRGLNSCLSFTTEGNYFSGKRDFLIMVFENLDFSRIPQKAVKNYLRKHQAAGAKSFQDLRTTCYQEKEADKYMQHVKSYLVRQNIEVVWKAYRQMNPLKDWNGRLLSLGMLYNRNSDQVFYCDQSRTELETRQIVFVNLKLLGSLFQRGTAHEVMKIDDQRKIMYFCYLAAGEMMAKGSQQIELTVTPDNYTLVTHRTFYASSSKILKLIYPFFHERMIDDFHRNVQAKILV